MELVLEKIPTNVLYGLQASVMQEVKSRARADATNLAIDHEMKDILQVTCEKIMLEKEEEKKNTDNLEKKLTEVYKSILDCAQEQEVTTKVKIQPIVKTMERYNQEITELAENLL
jgi:methyl coenzyme M reductase subunit D